MGSTGSPCAPPRRRHCQGLHLTLPVVIEWMHSVVNSSGLILMGPVPRPFIWAKKNYAIALCDVTTILSFFRSAPFDLDFWESVPEKNVGPFGSQTWSVFLAGKNGFWYGFFPQGFSESRASLFEIIFNCVQWFRSICTLAFAVRFLAFGFWGGARGLFYENQLSWSNFNNRKSRGRYSICVRVFVN